jgi:3-oxoadipate enol-lactonase
VPGRARIAYRAVGAGPPLLLTHGIGSTAASFAPVADHLGRSHHVLAVDLRGYGDSGDEPPAAGWDTFAEDVAAVHGHTAGACPADLVAASAGTPTALAFCLAYPDRVRSLTLIGPTRGDAADPGARVHGASPATPPVPAFGSPGQHSVVGCFGSGANHTSSA